MPSILSPLALLFAASPMQRAVNALNDDTFTGIHQLNWFDWMLLIPYFAIMIVLSIYGLHRYEVMRSYLKVRKKLPAEPPTRLEELPRVTVQLPLYNERYVVERLVEAIVKLDYPKQFLQIQVLDDSTDDTHPFTEALVERTRAMGHPI
jgi:cellulose synthase/poly-beta-1,6-N-acetylglucosamine synthase-like glycosyltransferase